MCQQKPSIDPLRPQIGQPACPAARQIGVVEPHTAFVCV
jgi:hypothetical protein